MVKLLIVVGTRPNFIKVTRFREVAERFPSMEVKMVHTGQHYDNRMASVFFEQFNLRPDFLIDIAQGSPAFQVGQIISKLAGVMETYRPDLVIVTGDVNSTLAGAIAANKLGIKLAHIESGLRSFDRSMPEEHNRVVTDGLSDIFFVTEQSGYDNLLKEGKNKEQIYFAGNTMIDTMLAFSDRIDASDALKRLLVSSKDYAVMTMHRPSNVDTKEGLDQLIGLIDFITTRYTLVFPVHPRTLKNMAAFNLDAFLRKNKKLVLAEPMDYFGFQKLVKESAFVITDSGGIQEESTYLRVPCLTLRPNTERPVTITIGTNELVPFNLSLISQKINAIQKGTFKKGQIPPFWDGHATERIMEAIVKVLA